MEELYNKLMSDLIEENDLMDLNTDEAECICLAWLLKTKLYMIGETSHKWSAAGKHALNHEMELIGNATDQPESINKEIKR
jgi:hypothetical protein